MALCVMATPFCINAPAHAKGNWQSQYHLEDGWYETEHDSLVFKWGAQMALNANYIWRGMYIGALNIQPEVYLGLEGFRAGMWWNIGASDWGLKGLSPEVDVYLSYSKWGLSLILMEMYYFDRYKDGTRSRFFDLGNHEPGGGGVTTEVRLKYRISDRLPLSILWCTRFSGRDGYIVGEELRRAYSTYIELGYDFRLPWELTLSARLGLTPWKSLYTNFDGGFAVVNTQVQLTRSWPIAQYADLFATIDLIVNPYTVKETKLIWNAGLGIQFK